MFLRSCNRRLAADENGLICAEILNQNTKHFGYLGSRTWPYKRGEPPQLQRDSWAVCSLFNIDLDRLRYSKLLSDGRSRIYKDITRQTHIGIPLSTQTSSRAVVIPSGTTGGSSICGSVRGMLLMNSRASGCTLRCS